MTLRSYSPDSPRSPDTGVLWLNHFGSSASSDSGRDGLRIMRELNTHVIVADRPGSGLNVPIWQKHLGKDYLGAMGRVCRRVLREAGALGLSNLVVAGRSGGGSAALAAIATKELPVVAGHTQESVGWHSFGIAPGRAFVDAYNREQQRLLATHPDILSPEPTDQVGLNYLWRKLQIWLHGPVDAHNSAGVWSKPTAEFWAFSIASGQPDVPLDFHFAETSLAITPKRARSLKAALTLVRPNGADVNVTVHPGTVHKSFDAHAFSIGLLAGTVDRVLPPTATPTDAS